MLGAITPKHFKEIQIFKMRTKQNKSKFVPRALRTCIGLITLSFLLASFFSVDSSAQTSKGIIGGVITEGTGAVVVGARVTAKSTLSGETRTVVSGQGGVFRIEAVNPGIYNIEISADGF